MPKLSFSQKMRYTATIDSIILISKNLRKAVLILLFDIIIWVTLIIANRLSASFAKFLTENASSSTLIALLALTLMYYGILILVYSFFKLAVLDSIKSMLKKSEFKIKRIWRFFLLNGILFLIFTILLFILGYALQSVNEQSIIIAFTTIVVPMGLLFYVLLNLSHSMFYEESSIKISLIGAFKNLIKPKPYFILLQSIIVLAVLLILLNFAYIGFPNQVALTIAFEILLYMLFFINRVSFYKVALNVKNHPS